MNTLSLDGCSVLREVWSRWHTCSFDGQALLNLHQQLSGISINSIMRPSCYSILLARAEGHLWPELLMENVMGHRIWDGMLCLFVCTVFFQRGRAVNMLFELYGTGALLSGLYSMLLDEPSKAFMGVTFAFGFWSRWYYTQSMPLCNSVWKERVTSSYNTYIINAYAHILWMLFYDSLMIMFTFY